MVAYWQTRLEAYWQSDRDQFVIQLIPPKALTRWGRRPLSLLWELTYQTSPVLRSRHRLEVWIASLWGALSQITDSKIRLDVVPCLPFGIRSIDDSLHQGF